jgi:hypothetical protein
MKQTRAGASAGPVAWRGTGPAVAGHHVESYVDVGATAWPLVPFRDLFRSRRSDRSAFSPFSGLIPLPPARTPPRA